MTEERRAFQWRALGKTVRGAMHERTGLPNQDALHIYPSSGVGPPLVLAVSDGHGASRYLRSDRGAKFAAKIATTLLRKVAAKYRGEGDLSLLRGLADEHLPKAIVRDWKYSVQSDLDRTPLSSDELAQLAAREGFGVRSSLEKDPTLAYGATLLAVLVTDGYLMYLQLGDGDILTVSDEGHVMRPVPKDDRLIGNETTSLISDQAWRDFRSYVCHVGDTPPALVLVSSDGYANSFQDDAGFLKTGSDLLEMMRAEGAEAIKRNLAIWLAEASQSGSGDDIALGLIYRVDITGASPRDTLGSSSAGENVYPEMSEATEDTCQSSPTS